MNILDLNLSITFNSNIQLMKNPTIYEEVILVLYEGVIWRRDSWM